MNSIDLSKTWPECTIIGFDLETTGKYPLGAEICEMAAIKWRDGEVVGEFQTLIKPSGLIPDEVIAIHNITNEMVKDAPKLSEKLKEFYNFIGDGVMIAHHSPFDMGFLAHEFEKANLPLPKTPVLCSSLISRRAIPESENHKMVTLIKTLGLKQGQSHRALDDARSCLDLTMKCFERLGKDKTINDLIEYQGQNLKWSIFSMNALRQLEVMAPIIKAIENHEPVQITYAGGSRRGQARTVHPEGIVRRSVVDDFLVAKSDPKDEHPKRYFLKKITSSSY